MSIKTSIYLGNNNLLRLRDALSVLDKSSPYSVSTNSELTDLELNKIKKHLYIETEIEKAFALKLSQLKENEILFLCGSSGDGKSELLTRYYNKYKHLFDFHLDATHSFEPKTTAIDTLNKLFLNQKEVKRPLVVGINIGMLGNFAEEASSNHDDIKSAIKTFLNSKVINQNQYYFLDFEAFPKFDLLADLHSSDFIQQLLTNVTEKSDDNPLYVLFKQELLDGDTVLCANYRLLSMSSVQSIIIDLLLRSRLVKDQFITARALLDFIHYLLTGPSYLFDNLFNESDNELGSKIAEFDPCAFRKKNLDLFVLHRNLKLPSDEFSQFISYLTVIGIDYSNEIINQYSFVRLFFILKDQDFSNNYHLNFKSDFDDYLIDQYARIWRLHAKYKDDKEDKVELKKFYKEIVLTAINRYTNRNASELNNDEFFISSHNDWNLTVELELGVNYHAIKKVDNPKISFFLAHIKIGEKKLPPIPISMNLLHLMTRIIHGYRPNKHDKNTIVLLDEIVEQIIVVANNSNILHLHTGSKKIKIKQVDQDDIEVSEI